MSESKKDPKEPSLFEKFRRSDNQAVSLVRELAWVAAVVGGIALALFLICGTWPAVVTIESESMVPHMNIGDLVVVVAQDRFGNLQTWTEGKQNGYMTFQDYGDVIVYKPNGATNVHPIIHRARTWVDNGNTVSYTTGAPIQNSSKGYSAPHPGYITKGDNNAVIDQGAWTNYRGLGPIQPVEKEWVIGKAVFAVPLLGYLPLNIVPIAIIIVIIMVLYEVYARTRRETAEDD
jgi:signal peptidase I